MNVKDDLSLNDLVNKTREVSIERSEQILTIAESLRQEGKIEGKLEGKIEGIVEGIEVAIELKYGTEALFIINDIRKIKSLDKIERIKELIKVKDSFDEFREVVYENYTH